MNPYLKMQVETSTPVERVILLYDKAILLLKEALTSLRQGDIPGKVNSIAKAERIIQVLNSSLDMEAGGEVAKSLREFYETLLAGLFIANKDNDELALENAIMMLERVKEAWEEVKLKG
ncbi:flagellar export chaperone FliS [Thermovibrio sp.]